jgi:hypothetical protein
VSATTLAPVIVKTVRDEPSVINAETVVRNLLIAFENEIEEKVIIKITEEIRP